MSSLYCRARTVSWISSLSFLCQNCEVDLTVVSKASGVLLCEVKDKGHAWEADAATAEEQQQRDAAVAKELGKMVEQLNDSEKVWYAETYATIN